ncbi:MAG: CRISPR-associated protein Cas5 [Pseudomonadota bacterium]|nr:CRISPR-associated protein Cas5 [Pseudomonadota bacterium]
METLSFRWRGRFGHFLRAEANVNAFTYPIPPRTAIQGLIAAILGLEKDSLGEALAGVRIALSGVPPQRFWHRVKLRKDPPAALPFKVKAKQKGSRKPEKATLVLQEWLYRPDFTVTCALPDQSERFTELCDRVRERRWHFGPCLGLSELLADVEWLSEEQAEPLREGDYRVQGPCRADQVELRAEDGLGIHLLRLPHSVDAQRTFRHRGYYLEHQGRPIPVHTRHAWRVGGRELCFW